MASVEELREILERRGGRVIVPVTGLKGVFIVRFPAMYDVPAHLAVIIKPEAALEPVKVLEFPEVLENMPEPEIRFYGSEGFIVVSHMRPLTSTMKVRTERLDDLVEELARQKEWHERKARAIGQAIKILKDRRLHVLIGNVEKANPRNLWGDEGTPTTNEEYKTTANNNRYDET